MTILRRILSARNLETPDGRLLHAYDLTTQERGALAQALHGARINRRLPDAAGPVFVLWAAEKLRAELPGGRPTWDILFAPLEAEYEPQRVGGLVAAGLARFRRPVRRSEAGLRLWLYTLLAEGGLPDAALAESGRFRSALLGLIAEIETEGALGVALAEAAARRWGETLPQAFRTEDSARLIAELACGLAVLRRTAPSDLDASARLVWLDRERPGWRDGLPLRLSPRALEALVLPALAAEAAPPRPEGPGVRRGLRRRSDGPGWAGVASILEGGLLPTGALSPTAQGLRLRLLPETGPALFGTPEEGGWRLSRALGRGPVVLPLSPDAALTLSAHADGRALGEATLDPGAPPPDEAPSLWRPVTAYAGETDAEELAPLGVGGRTRASVVWLLAGDDDEPEPSPGLVIGAPVPGPGGRLWPLSGEGALRVGAITMRIVTGADVEGATVQFAAVGPLLPGFTAQSGVAVYRGAPRLLGGVAGTPLRGLGAAVSERPARGLLGGRIAEWRDRGASVAALRYAVLPADLSLRLTESGHGRLRLDAAGLDPRWSVMLRADRAEVAGHAAPDGALLLSLILAGEPPTSVDLRLVDAASGSRIALAAPWPGRIGAILDPKGRRLTANRAVAVASLGHWRGWLPEQGGSVLLRIAGDGPPVGFRAAGPLRLAAQEPLLRQALALAGPDGRINLRLVCGTETPRLEIGRYDWTATLVGDALTLGDGVTRLDAFDLCDPTERRRIDCEGTLLLADWLGREERQWFVQGRHPTHGVMRPVVWSPLPHPQTTRETRISAFEDGLRAMLADVSHPGWVALETAIAAARAGGDAGALDQVQALGRVPAAAVALLLRAPRTSLSEALALEEAAPLWWPLVACEAWVRGLEVARDQLRARLAAHGFSATEGRAMADRALVASCSAILTLRSELAAHLGQALARNGLPPMASTADGAPTPLAVANPAPLLRHLAQRPLQQGLTAPQGASGMRATTLTFDLMSDDSVRAILDAPLIAAETATGLRAPLDPGDTLRLLALRAADAHWFDAALPAALCLALTVTA